ncbi:DUF262 domain-containing protein [Vibrio sp. FF59]|uniref:GmrSD restriction endonuclease domain-containing protein n=1 Tax=Vibrio sp. FF59 TaxID=3230011 RepID=UPI00352F0A65
MSDMEINANSGERLSFYQMFEQKNMKVEIPIIQRDYAQGRIEVADVRNTFLQALHDYLDQGEPFRDLDFVYGSVTTNTKGRNSFIPLDGQQRLTTLFLLHWYLAQISGNGESFRKVLSAGGTSHFTYETRSSSKEFCNALVTSGIDFNALLMESGIEYLSKTIKDKAWFYLSWESDPTICSMLTMLDAIHYKFARNADFFEKLVDKEKPVITFRFLNLAQFKLTDDLYIKMNARGKPLTDFENFKARLEKTIKSFSGEWPEYRLSFKIKPVLGYEYFIHKIDTDWTDLFWHYRNIASQDDTYDDELMNFIGLCVANFLLLQEKENNYSLQKRLFGSGGRVNQLSFMEYEQYRYITKPLIIELIKHLDLVRGTVSPCFGVAKYLENKRYYDEESIFEKVIGNSSSFPEKLRFHAFYSCVAKGKAGVELLSWMRVVFNLTENTIINSVDEYQRALRSIDELAQMDGAILDLLIQDVPIHSFLAIQVFEEKLKAHLLMKSHEWETAILELEGDEFFRGQIGYALKFSGVVEYFNEHGNVGWFDAEEDYLEQFRYYAKVGSVLFTAIAPSSKALNFAWERAVLSKGEYLTSTSADRFNLLSSRTNKNNVERDHSWRRLIRVSLRESDRWNKAQKYVKAVLDDPAFDLDDLRSGLEAICAKALTDNPFDWRAMLIGKPELYSLCNQGFIVKNAREVVLLHESQRNHTHSELYSRYLELELEDSGLSTAPFMDRTYLSVRSREDTASFDLSGFHTKDQEYGMEIWYEDGQYTLLFYRSEDSISFPHELKNILELCGFTRISHLQDYQPEDWLCSDENYVCYCTAPQYALAKIAELCPQLMGLSNE